MNAKVSVDLVRKIYLEKIANGGVKFIDKGSKKVYFLYSIDNKNAEVFFHLRLSNNSNDPIAVTLNTLRTSFEELK